jgi:predicted nucleic acid-binding protein
MAARSKKRSVQRVRFVLDCSVVFAWYFADEANSYADAVATSLIGAEAIVPMLWPLEVANTLLSGERRRRSSEAQASSFINRLTALPIILDEQTAGQAWSAIMSLARKHDLSSYDGAYLELASRHALPLATLDKKLKEAAKAAGISIYSP